MPPSSSARPRRYTSIVFEPAPGGGYGRKDPFVYISWRQPIELGHQPTHRHAIAKAAYSQAQWTIVQSELTAIVQTYRLFETAAYRRERLRVARQLSEFNGKLLTALRKRLEVNPTSAAIQNGSVRPSWPSLEAIRVPCGPG